MDVPSTSSQGSSRSDIENEPVVDDDMTDMNPVRPVDAADGDKNKESLKKKESVSMPRNQLDDGNEVDNVAEQNSIVSRKDQSFKKRSAPLSLSKEQKMQVEAYGEKEMVSNDFPKHARNPVARFFLELTELEPIQNGRHSKGEFLPDADMKCCICSQAEDNAGDTELIDCHGTMNGEMKGPERIYELNKIIREKNDKSTAQWEKEAKDEKKGAPQLRLIPERQHACRSKFHMRCIMTYNAGDYYFQYASRIECQAKFLCPLHCCYRCNINHQKQSSYVADLVECALCLRSFHTQCYPAGARDQYVTFDTDQGERQFEMVICPDHPDELPAKINKPPAKNGTTSSKTSRAVDGLEIKTHLRGCLYTECEFFKAMAEGRKKLEELPPLIECTTCIRAFHRECCEVETIDGVPIAENQCEACACKDIIPIGMTVLAAWNSGFFLAKTVSWYEYPSKDRAKQKNFERSGYTVVEWKDGSSSEKSMSILPVCQMTELIENYVRTASKNVKTKWGRAFTEKDERGFYWAPPVTKKVYQEIRVSKLFGSARPQLQDLHGVCDCKEKPGRGKCYDSDCKFVQEEAECVPECGKSCENRKISTGYVNKKLVLRDTKKYGYGVFTKESVAKFEFLTEYAGEIISAAEKKRRLQVINLSRDFQCNNYMMDLPGGLCVDAARYGNIARYINHSCEPNSRAVIALVYNRRDKDTFWYEPRAYLQTLRPIAAGEEITFSYDMGDNEMLPCCMCGTASCLGYMTTTTKKTMNPKMKKFNLNNSTAVAKKEVTKKNGETSKDTRPAKKRDASQGASGTPSKRSYPQVTRTPVNTNNEASTSATPAPEQKDSPLVSSSRNNRPSNVLSSPSPRTPILPSSSGTGGRQSIQFRALVSAQVGPSALVSAQAGPSASVSAQAGSSSSVSAQAGPSALVSAQVAPSTPPQARRSSPRGRSVQVPVHVAAPVLQAPVPPVQPPIQDAQNQVQANADGLPAKRQRQPKKYFQNEGY